SVQASELWMRVLVGYAVANGFFLLCVFSVAGLKYERPVLTLEERLDERRWVPTLVPDAAIPWILSLPFLPAVLIAKLFGK
ncbi:MAG: hypothetical protein Q7R83_01265, partial [bacterium]|nr:hypothetical protein [bacterium]